MIQIDMNRLIYIYIYIYRERERERESSSEFLFLRVQRSLLIIFSQSETICADHWIVSDTLSLAHKLSNLYRQKILYRQWEIRNVYESEKKSSVKGESEGQRYDCFLPQVTMTFAFFSSFMTIYNFRLFRHWTTFLSFFLSIVFSSHFFLSFFLSFLALILLSFFLSFVFFSLFFLSFFLSFFLFLSFSFLSFFLWH